VAVVVCEVCRQDLEKVFGFWGAQEGQSIIRKNAEDMQMSQKEGALEKELRKRFDFLK
jgi:hypothetical protein